MHSAEPHEPRDARRSSIEPIERVLPFCCNLISQGLGGHCAVHAVSHQLRTDPSRQLPERLFYILSTQQALLQSTNMLRMSTDSNHVSAHEWAGENAPLSHP